MISELKTFPSPLTDFLLVLDLIICSAVTQSCLRSRYSVSNGSCNLNPALQSNNQSVPSCFTRLTSSPEDDLTRRQRRPRATDDPPRDSLAVWATPRRRGWEWSRCGRELGRRKVRCRSSPPVSCCLSGSTRCPDSVCRCLESTRKTKGQIHPEPSDIYGFHTLKCPRLTGSRVDGTFWGLNM